MMTCSQRRFLATMDLSSQSNLLQPIRQASLPALWHRLTKDDLEKELFDCKGIVTLICNKLDCSYKQLYNALDHYGLRDSLKQAKEMMLGQAEEVVVKSLQSDNEAIALKAAETVLKSRFAMEQGWGSGPQVNIAQQIVSDSDKALQIRNIFGIQDTSRSPEGEAIKDINPQDVESSRSALSAFGEDPGEDNDNAVS